MPETYEIEAICEDGEMHNVEFEIDGRWEPATMTYPGAMPDVEVISDVPECLDQEAIESNLLTQSKKSKRETQKLALN